jgi:DNA polymerase III delta prime subunit
MQKMLVPFIPASMIFFGRPGTGKTSAARIFLDARGDCDSMSVDGSNDNGVDKIRNMVEGFSSTYAFTPGIKICFIDDADYLSKSAQASLRGVIERSSHSCRFIFAVNDVTKIDPALRSRLLPINFVITDAERPAILVRIQKRVSERLVELGYSFDRALVADNLCDLRSMANKIEFELGPSSCGSI